MKIAHNPQTDEYLGLQDGKWQKLTVAANKEGQRVYLGPDGWTPLDASSVATPQNTPKPKPESTNLQKLGIGTRGVLKGVLDTVAFPAAAAQNAVASLAGRPDWQAGSVGDAVSDIIGLPQPQTGGERAAMRFNEGASSLIPAFVTGGLMGGAASPVTRAVGTALQDAPALQAVTGGASTAAAGAVGDNGGGQFAQMLAGLAVPAAASGAIALAPGTRVNMARADAFRRAIGEVPSLGVVSDGGLAPMLEAGLAKYPVTAGTMRKAWGNANDALRTSVEDAAGRVSGGPFPQTQNELGQAVIDGVTRAKADALGAYSAGWDDQIFPYVNTNVPLNNTFDLFAQKALRRTPEAAFERAAEVGGASGLAPQAQSAAAREAMGGASRMLGGVWDDSLNLDAASLGAVKDKRTVLMESINNNNVADTMGVSSAEAKRVSESLRDDMFAALDQKAPRVANKLREMDGEYAQWAKRAEKVDKRITGNAREPEEAAQKLEPKSLTLGDVIRLRDMLTPEEWGKIRGGIMNELPRSTQNETSGAAFATKTGTGKSAYRPEVRREIWGDELDDAMKISEGINRVGANINTSDTATQIHTMGALGSVATIGGLIGAGMLPEAAVLAASVYGLPYGAARFATSPTVTRTVTSPSYQNAIQSALRSTTPMMMRGLMSPMSEKQE